MVFKNKARKISLETKQGNVSNQQVFPADFEASLVKDRSGLFKSKGTLFSLFAVQGLFPKELLLTKHLQSETVEVLGKPVKHLLIQVKVELDSFKKFPLYELAQL